jgi:hypothetical protein
MCNQIKLPILKVVLVLIMLSIIYFSYTRRVLPRVRIAPFNQDFASDYVGARALINKVDELYPILGPAFARIGLDWDITHRSTHPPTTYLIAVPFSFFPYRVAQVLWMITMFACIVLSARLLGLAWYMSVFVAVLSLAWPPTFWSLFQYTPIWMLGLVLAYRFHHRPFVSGVFIALASLPKFLAAPSLIYNLRRRQWSTLFGFSALWLGALGLLLLLRSDSIYAYISSNIDDSVSQVLRQDNSALLVVAWRLGRWPGLAMAFVLIVWVLWSGFRRADFIGWSCLVWIGIALLPITWNYSIFPLLPWLLLVSWISGFSSRLLAIAALVLPYAAAVPTRFPLLITMSIVLSGIAFAAAPKVVNISARSLVEMRPILIGSKEVALNE